MNNDKILDTLNQISLIELMFESVLCAQKAKAALNGADIYAGCCTLKIEYARVNIFSALHQRNIYVLDVQFELTFFLILTANSSKCY